MGEPLMSCATITPATRQQQWPFGRLAGHHAMPRCGGEREADRIHNGLRDGSNCGVGVVRIERLEQAEIDLRILILLIRGKLSDVVSVEGVQDFLEKVPNAEFVELADAGHTAAGGDNDAFTEAVVLFVKR